MPPKEKKKKKLTKKQKRLLEQKKKEEEERLRREEEERRIAEEKERERRELEERLRKEEERRLALERERISKEEAEYLPTVEKRKFALQSRKKEIAAIDEWEKYLECSDLPDTRNAADMNAFLSIWRDSLGDGERRNLSEDFAECSKGLKLARQVEIDYNGAKLDKSEKMMAHFKEFFNKTRNTIIDTLDDSTVFIMQFCDELMTHPEDEQYIQTADGIKYGLWMNLSRRNLRTIEFKGLNITTELALRGMTQRSIAMRTIVLDYDVLSMTAPVRPLFQPIGGILYMEILEMPARPIIKSAAKSAKKSDLRNASKSADSARGSNEDGDNEWVIREVTELANTVRRVPYKEESLQGVEMEAPVTRVTFIVPNNVLVRRETPDIAWWDNEAKIWNREGISDEHYDPEERKISFGTRHLTTALALVQPIALDAPFEFWSLCPLPEAGKSCALLTIIPKKQISNVRVHIDEISILIYENRCRLMKPRLPELAHLNDKFLLPRELLNDMAQAGINIMLDDSAASEETGHEPKSHTMENKAYAEMSLVAGICSYAMSKWNHSGAVTAKEGVFRVARKLHDPRMLVYSKNMDLDFDTMNMALSIDPNDSSSWHTVVYDDFKCGFVDCSEDSAEFCAQPPGELDTHLNLYTCLQELHGQDTIERMTDSSDMALLDTIETMLRLVRPLSW